MFEQSSPSSYSYDYTPAPEPLKEGDPFYDYEIKGWKLGPRIYKILGVSAVANLLLFAVIVQGSLLTMKGCDSPVVGRMCEVLDTVYVGSMLFGTEREWKDVEYDKTDLGDVDITYVDVSSEKPPLEYPAGYFAVANPEKYTIDPETGVMIAALPPQGVSDLPQGYIAPGIPYSPTPGTTGDLFNTTPIYPKHNPKILEGGPLPEPGNSGTSPGPPFSRKRRGGGRVTTSPGTNPGGPIPGIPGSGQVADVKPSPSPHVEPTGPVEPGDINTRPFKDLAKEVNALLDQKQLDLQAQVQILATAKLGKDGKIINGSFKANGSSSDKNLAGIVTQAVAAFNDSNLLNYLKELSGKDLSFLVRQDDTNVIAAIRSQVESETRAQSIASVVQFGITLSIQKKEKAIQELEAENDPAKAEALQNLKDDRDLLKGTTVGTDGKFFVVNFQAPKTTVHPMIQRKLAEQKTEQKQSSGGGVTPAPTNNTAKN